MTASGSTWWERALPAVAWLRGYQRSWFRLDFAAGITLAAYLLPAALGDASLANLPPETGLYACLFGSLVFWIFCGSRYTAVSVTSAISLVIGTSLSEMTGGNTTRFGALAAGTALLVSLIGFVAWLAKAGVMVHFISESVMTGFKCGVALFLASTQLPKLFGFHGAHGSFWGNTGFFFKHLNETNTMSFSWRNCARAPYPWENFSEAQTGRAFRRDRRHNRRIDVFARDTRRKADRRRAAGNSAFQSCLPFTGKT